MMIVDDAHEVAFVHIPKCGGTSVSRQLRLLDSNNEFFKDVRDHPELGRTHFSHLPLFYLRDYYPGTFDRIAAYRAFALARDPYVRFASSTIQHLDEFRGFDRAGITTQVALAEARRIMEWLGRRDRFSTAEYMHFTRQSDYVELDGLKVVGNIFPLENVSDLAAAIGWACGVRLDPDRRENTSFSSDGPVLRILRTAKPVYSRLTRWTFRRDLLLLARRLRLQNPSPFYAAVRQDPDVSAFVREYYARDFRVYEQAKARIAQQVGADTMAYPLIKGAERSESGLRHVH